MDYVNSSIKTGDITAFEFQTVDVNWTDDIDINYYTATKEQHEAYFNT